jgi:hypothetical protein
MGGAPRPPISPRGAERPGDWGWRSLAVRPPGSRFWR